MPGRQFATDSRDQLYRLHLADGSSRDLAAGEGNRPAGMTGRADTLIGSHDP